MTEFTTFKRWALEASASEAEVMALIREAILPAYQKLPGCLKLGLLRIEGTNSYLATQRWRSRAARDAALASPEYAAWFAAYQPALARWDELMAFVNEWEAEDVLGAGGDLTVNEAELKTMNPSLSNPDGYRLDFERVTDAPEESEY